MTESYAQILAIGGKSNSLGRAAEVVDNVLHNPERLAELYDCLFEDDAWLRMRAADSLEKVCRIHPQWLEPYTDRLLSDVAKSSQPSLQWHLAQMIAEISLTPTQEERAIDWLKQQLRNKDVDWIVAANVMTTLAQFAKQQRIPVKDAIALITTQQDHTSSSVRKRAAKLLAELGA